MGWDLNTPIKAGAYIVQKWQGLLAVSLWRDVVCFRGFAGFQIPEAGVYILSDRSVLLEWTGKIILWE